MENLYKAKYSYQPLWQGIEKVNLVLLKSVPLILGLQSWQVKTSSDLMKLRQHSHLRTLSFQKIIYYAIGIYRH